MDRFEALEKENKERVNADARAKKDYQNSKDYRVDQAVDDSIFNESNLSIPLISLAVDYFKTKSSEEITGTAPYFHFRPKHSAAAEVAPMLDKYLNARLNGDNLLRDDLEDAYHNIFTQRAAIFKAVFREEVDEWEEFDRIVLYDAATGEPVMIVDGGDVRPVLPPPDDEWIADVGLDENDQPVIPLLRHGVDNSLTIPAGLVNIPPGEIAGGIPYYWDVYRDAVAFRETLFSGPRSVQVDYDAFVAPMKERDFESCDFLGEKYDRTAAWVRRRYLEREWKPWADYEATIKHEDADAKTDTSRNKESEDDMQYDPEVKRVKLIECWVERDVLGRGRPQRFCVFIDVERRVAVYYEYSAVLLPDARMRQPYTPVSVWKMEDRWWGKSIPEMLFPFAEYVDLQFNRWTYRNSINENPIIGEHKGATRDGLGLKDVGPYETVELADGMTMQDWLEAFVFPQTDRQTGPLIDRIFYLVQLWLGIANLAQGDYSEIPQNTTAYGMDATLRESGKISREWSRRIIRGFRHHISKLCLIEFATMDEEVGFLYRDGETDINAYMNRVQLEGMDVDVELVMSRSQTQATIEANRLAEEIVTKYNQYDPIMRQRLRPFYRQSLMALGHDDVETYLPPPTEEEIQAYLAAPPEGEEGVEPEGEREAGD